jgi:hypothetical protein
VPASEISRDISGYLGTPYLPLTVTMQTRSSKSASSEEEVHLPDVRLLESKAYWSIKDEATLIKFFLGRRAAFTSNKMFKKTVFADAAKEVNSMREKGSEKTGASCKAKWGKVCVF